MTETSCARSSLVVVARGAAAAKGLSSLDEDWLLRADATCKTLQTSLSEGASACLGTDLPSRRK